MPAPSSLNLCRELATDPTVIREVEMATFGWLHEAALVEALQAAAALMLSGVAEVDGIIVGRIAFGPVTIEGKRASFGATALAPMAVRPDWQRKGVGSALIRWSLDECRRDRQELVLVLGHLDYYPRFVFVPAMPLDVRCQFEVPSEAFTLLELRPGALVGRTESLRYRTESASV